MPSRTTKTRSLPLALSVLAHGCALAALMCFAPLSAGPQREPAPVTVRFVPHHDAPAEEIAPPHSTNRGTLPPEEALAPIPMELQSELELPDETTSFASELPASAPRGAIGVGAAGALRVPHPRAIPGEEHDAPGVATTPAPVAVVASAPVEETTLPMPLACPAPEYPAACASVGEVGRVKLEIRIGTDGRVESVRVLRSSGFPRLDEAAETGVRSWRFHPARRAGAAVAWRLEHTIVFRVEAGR